MAYGQGTDPRNIALLAANYVYGPGKIISYQQDEDAVKLCAAGEYPLGISAGEGSRAAGGAYDATGGTVSFYPLGATLMVQAVAAEAWETGEIAYCAASGLVTKTAGSNKKLGIYVGASMTTAALGANGAGDTAAASSEGEMIAIATAGYEVGEQAS